MTLPPTSPWHAALTRMLAARSSPVYMPAMVLALIDLVDAGLAPGGVVQFADIEHLFDATIAPLFPGGVGKAWQPFFHLSRSMRLWTLHRGPQPATFADLQARRPKSRGALCKRADCAIVEPALWAALQHRPRRVEIAAWLRVRLSHSGAQRQALGARAGGVVGRPFVATPPPKLTAEARLIESDPAAPHAGSVRHHELVAELSARLRARRLQPLLPRAVDPQFDLGWRDRRLHLIEVKSLSEGSETHQLRLGLGQVLEYRHRVALREGLSPRVFLAVARKPKRPYWDGACRTAGVTLAYGPEWAGLP